MYEKLNWNKTIFRFANILKLKSVSIDNIMGAVKAIKAKTSLDLECVNYKSMLQHDVMLSQVKNVEQMLQVESFELNNETLTNEELKMAAEMFLYLISCPNLWFKFWFSFYSEFFLAESADQILLTLNRMTKISSPHNRDGKIRAVKLLLRTASLLSLQFEEIQRLLPEKEVANESPMGQNIPKGALCSSCQSYKNNQTRIHTVGVIGIELFFGILLDVSIINLQNFCA